MLDGMKTFGTDHLSANQFHDAIHASHPGACIIYAIGDLSCSIDRGKADGASGELRTVRDMAYDLYKKGGFFLTQRRLPERTFLTSGASFEYRITKERVPANLPGMA